MGATAHAMPAHSAMKNPRPARLLETGFTLIEVMVVILILGLIVSVVVPNLDFLWNDAQEKTAAIQAKRIHEAVSYYEKGKGKLPDDLSVLTQKDDRGQALLSELPNDPWQNPFKLVVDSQSQWMIVSFGPDRTENTTDDITSVRSEK